MAGNKDSGKPKYHWDTLQPGSVRVFLYDTEGEYQNITTTCYAVARRRDWHVETMKFRSIGCLVVIRRW